MKILVVGGSGLLGSMIVRQLRERGHEVRALARKRAVDGVENIAGDLRDAASLARAVSGVDAVVSGATSIGTDNAFTKVDGDGTLALVNAAKQAGVKTFVFVSLSPNHGHGYPLARAKRRVEAAVRASGMQWAVLQPSYFMDVWLGGMFGWSVEKATARVFGSGEQLVSFVAAKDVARCAVEALEQPPNRAIAVGGPRDLSPNQAVAIFEAAANKPMKVMRVPAFVFRLMGATVGRFSEFFGTVAGLSLAFTAGDRLTDWRGETTLEALLRNGA